MRTDTRFIITFFAALIVCEIAAAFETSMIFAAMSRLVEEFGNTQAAGWLVTGYLLIGAGMAALIGRLGDMYGRRQIMIYLLSAGFVGSVISAVSTDFSWVLIGRCIQGLTAALLPLCFGLIREHLPAKFVSLGVGIMASSAGAGTILGLLIGGLIVDNFPWRAIFIASSILTAIAVLVAYFLIPISTRPKSTDRPDFIGGILFVPGIALTLLAVSKGSSWGWTSNGVLWSFAIGAVFFVAWILQSLRHPSPLMDVRLFSNRNILIANVGMAILALGALQITQVFSLLLQQPEWTGIGLGVSATEAALTKLPSNLIALAAGPLVGFMALRMGDRSALTISFFLTAGGWASALIFNESTMQVLLALITIAFATTMAYACLPGIIVKSAPMERTSEATGMLSVVRTAFMAAGAQFVSILLSTDNVISPTDATVRFPSEAAYTIVFATVAALCVLAGLSSIFITNQAPQAENTVPSALTTASRAE